MNETNEPITIYANLLHLLRPAACRCCACSTAVNIWLAPLSSSYHYYRAR